MKDILKMAEEAGFHWFCSGPKGAYYKAHEADIQSFAAILRAEDQAEIERLRTKAGNFFAAGVQAERELADAKERIAQLEQEAQHSEHGFKNFHRSLCARFDYTHDEIDWDRDLASLEEHIAAKTQEARGVPICRTCGTHNVAIQTVCHNSACGAYAKEVTTHEGWLSAAPKPPEAATGEPVAWLIDWPDEKDLGHYFSEKPCESGRSTPLYTFPPAREPLTATMFWDADDPETMGKDIQSLIYERQPGDIVKIDQAMRLSSITVRVGEGESFEVIEGGIEGRKG